MTTASIGLQDLRRKIYVKAKAEQSWRFWGLYVHVCRWETLSEAYTLAKRNQGAPGIDGVSFAPTLFGRPEDQAKPEYLYWEFTGYGGQQAVRMGDWKGVRQNMLNRSCTDSGRPALMACRHRSGIAILRRFASPIFS